MRFTTEADREKSHCLWDTLSAFASAETDRALSHLFETIGGWIGADEALWIACVRSDQLSSDTDTLSGWRPRLHLPWHPLSEEKLALIRELRRRDAAGDGDPGMTTRAIAARAGAFRSCRLRDGFVDFAAFRRTAHYHWHYESFGIRDRLWVLFPLNPDAESCFVFDRIATPGRFTRRHAALAGYALRGLRWFHLRLFLGHGLLVGRRELNDVQRRVVHALLTGAREADLAEGLGLSVPTTHKHVKAVYRAFGVNSRAELMALWLGGR